MKPENFQPSKAPDLGLLRTLNQWKEMNSEHVGDLLKVNGVNVLAFIVSISEVEASVRIFSCIAAGLYTSAKLVQTIQEILAKKNQKNERPR